MGDINLADINWTCNSISTNARNGAQCQHLLEISADCGFYQMIAETIHHTKASESLIDLLLTMNSSSVANTFYVPRVCVCKHDSMFDETNSYPQKS